MSLSSLDLARDDRELVERSKGRTVEGIVLIRDTPAGVEFDARVIPRARKTEITGIRDDVVVVRVAAPPVEGAANGALIECLSERLHVGRRAIRIVSGERSRNKRVAISGMTAARLHGALHPNP